MTVTEKTYDVSPELLFAAIVNPDTYPRWLVGTKAIRSVSPNWPDPDSFFKHTVGFGPIAVPDTTTLLAIDAPRSLELMVRARPVIEAKVRFDVIATGATSSLRMTETPVGVFRLTAPLTQPLIRARNERSLDRLRGLLEQSRP